MSVNAVRFAYSTSKKMIKSEQLHVPINIIDNVLIIGAKQGFRVHYVDGSLILINKSGKYILSC